MAKIPYSFDSGDFRLTRLGDSMIYRAIYRKSSDHGIPMTGSDVTKLLPIPFAHRLVRFEYCHKTSAYVLSTDALLMRLGRGSPLIPRFENKVFQVYDMTNSTGIEKFGLGYEYPSCTWKLVLNSTSTDIIYMEFYIQRL